MVDAGLRAILALCARMLTVLPISLTTILTAPGGILFAFSCCCTVVGSAAADEAAWLRQVNVSISKVKKLASLDSCLKSIVLMKGFELNMFFNIRNTGTATILTCSSELRTVNDEARQDSRTEPNKNVISAQSSAR